MTLPTYGTTTSGNGPSSSSGIRRCRRGYSVARFAHIGREFDKGSTCLSCAAILRGCLRLSMAVLDELTARRELEFTGDLLGAFCCPVPRPCVRVEHRTPGEENHDHQHHRNGQRAGSGHGLQLGWRYPELEGPRHLLVGYLNSKSAAYDVPSTSRAMRVRHPSQFLSVFHANLYRPPELSVDAPGLSIGSGFTGLVPDSHAVAPDTG